MTATAPLDMLDDQLRAALAHRDQYHLRRALRPLPVGALDLAANDYLGLARHPEVVAAACEATQRYGAGARASRLVSGHTALHAELEAALAAFKGCEAALVFPSGYQANLALLTGLTGEGDAVFCDKRNHASLLDATFLIARQERFIRYYNAPAKLHALLERYRAAGQRCFIVTDAVFSMDGDVVDLPQLLVLAREYDAYVILDDAHGTGTLGATGRGAVEHYGLKGSEDLARVIQMGTLSKALGSQGGFVVGSQTLIDYLVNTARAFIYTTGLNPAACGAALASLQIIQREPQRIARLRELTQHLATGLTALGYEAYYQPSPIIPVILGEAERALQLSEHLLQQGIWCPAIRPPTVPVGRSRLRVTASVSLSESDVEGVLRAFARAADYTLENL